MSNLNRIILIGKIASPPKNTSNNPDTVTVTTTLLVDRPKKQDGTSEVDHIPVIAHQRPAEFLLNNAKLNDFYLVEGKIQIRTEDDANGQRSWITEVIADQVKPFSISNSDSSSPTSQTQSQPQPLDNAQGKPQPETATNTEDNIPF